MKFKNRICPKCGAIMESLNTDSPNDMQGFRCPNRKNHPATSELVVYPDKISIVIVDKFHYLN